MSAPRAPRKARGGVDVQLQEFEDDLITALEHLLRYHINIARWDELDQLAPADREAINTTIDVALLDLAARYSDVAPVRAILDLTRVLFRSVVWASMNVPFPHDRQLHIDSVLDNLIEVFNREIYADLRTEMIMANHHAQVLQRNWRRCIADPSHPACRRRLEYEFRTQICSV